VGRFVTCKFFLGAKERLREKKQAISQVDEENTWVEGRGGVCVTIGRFCEKGGANDAYARRVVE